MNLRWRLSHAQGYLGLGMLREAEAELDAIDAADAERTEVAAVRVALLHEMKDWARLRDLARTLMQREPMQPGWWVSLAFATRRIDSLEKAHGILRDAEDFHPEEAIIQFNLGCYAAQLGDLDEARERVLRAIALNEDFRAIARHDTDLAPLRAREPDFPGAAPATADEDVPF
jgi:tetratricopeptide (TPR) repeat protein